MTKHRNSQSKDVCVFCYRKKKKRFEATERETCSARTSISGKNYHSFRIQIKKYSLHLSKVVSVMGLNLISDQFFFFFKLRSEGFMPGCSNNMESVMLPPSGHKE